jgi:hypothetical protein
MSDHDTLQLDQVDERFRPNYRLSANSNQPTMASAIQVAEPSTAATNVCVNADHVYTNLDHDSGGQWV